MFTFIHGRPLMAAMVLVLGVGFVVPTSSRAAVPLATAGRMDPETSRRYARTVLGHSLVCVGRLAHAVMQVPSSNVSVRNRFENVASQLFEADWKIAAIHDPAMDPAKAGAAFRQAWEASRAVQTVDVEALIGTHGRPAGGTSTSVASGLASLRAHQQSFLEDRGYAAVVPTLEREAFDADIVGTSLLKDAWFYVGLWTETAGWRAKNIQAERAMPPGRYRPAALDPYGGTEMLDRLDTVFREVWEWRFRAMHGMRRADRVLDRLTKYRLEPVPAALDVPPLRSVGGS